MSMLLKISLRNLLRQKRRNVLLGIGIAFGMSILIMANSFAHGLSDILLNKIIKFMTGHIRVMVMEQKEDKSWGLIRDKDRLIRVIDEQVQGAKEVYEGVSSQDANAGHTHSGRALGNGAAEFIVVVGVVVDDSFKMETDVVAGNLDDLKSAAFENPIALYDTMAEKLNVGLHDTIRVRFGTVYGQVQAAQFTVAALLKATNPFMSVAAFTTQETLKPLVGLMPQETASLSVIMKDLEDPTFVIEQAKRLHAALQPDAAGYQGQLAAHGQTHAVEVLAIAPEDAARQQFAGQVQLTAGNVADLWENEQGALISETLAQTLGVQVGDEVAATYETKFEGVAAPRLARVVGIFKSSEQLSAQMVVLHPQALYETCFPAVPQNPVILDRQQALFPIALKEWTLLPQTFDRESWEKKYKVLNDSDWRGRVVDVNTMYELASDVLKMEQVLDMITYIAVLVLFFIILIGVVNTLRMTIRERTREIGTVRAIGMQRGDVRWSFVLEVVFLAFFASLVGIGVGFAAMKLCSLPTIESDSMFTMFLLDKHLYFLPTLGNVVKNLAIILLIAFVTSFFPANRAARLSVADALRHFE